MISIRTSALIVLAGIHLCEAGDGPFVDMSFDEACKVAEQEKKVVFVDFYTTWCLPCKMMDESTFKDQKVIDWLQSKTVAIKVDADRNKTLATQFRVDAYPTLLLAKPDGSEMDRMVGMLQADAFLHEAKAILSGKDRLTRATEELATSGRQDPMARMHFADKLVRMDKYEEALAEYLWCFDEGGKSPGFYGVRLSFLLSDIARLGKKYPPALEALRERRDATRERILTAKPKPKKKSLLSFFLPSTPNYFADVHDFRSLNRALGESEQTLALYDRLRIELPELEAVQHLGTFCFDELLAARRYAEIAEFTDFDAEIKQQMERSKLGLAFLPEEHREEMEKSNRRTLVAQITSYYQILLGLERTEAAAQMTDTLAKLLHDFDERDEACDLALAILVKQTNEDARKLLRKCRDDLGCSSG